jgi:pyruvate dehydrogenase E1 component alpha subunit
LFPGILLFISNSPFFIFFFFTVLDDPNITSGTASKEELMDYFKTMYTIRRMEISCDTEYKARNIRGFCHLYDGQEAIALALKSGLTNQDNIITSYRCHAIQLIRGASVKAIVGELFGFELGSSKGKGGSMHFYNKATKFWGGQGIVGAQVPVGVGAAMAEMYLAKKNWPVNVGVAMYGDGAANQGQIWESANMAKLWNVPVIFLCENNQYGMGTSTSRHSSNNEYYKQGGVVIPGVQVDGMDVLASREAIKFCKQYAGSGKGPIFLEMKTYRYHGHSMSDPGITYRDRDEVASMRASRDCIEQTKNRIIEAGWATADELKEVEKQVRAEVAAEIEEARKGTWPREELLVEDIYYKEVPPYIRGVENGSDFAAASRASMKV